MNTERYETTDHYQDLLDYLLSRGTPEQLADAIEDAEEVEV